MREAQEMAKGSASASRCRSRSASPAPRRSAQHKTSMLQDVETGRPLELDALVGSVLELGRITGVPTPNLTAVHACTALLARTLAEEKGRLRIEPRG